ncbi:MAG: 30S ribosome-binding factor RbfA [Deltaproteobacteria bacterium]|nr:30S ribosome-binding factor RbfA [Deltaproteobacteria bacterium]
MSHNRPERVSELLHAEIARLLREDVSDPRLAACSVTRVRVSADLRAARVHVLPLGGEGDPADLLRGLKAASPYLRRQVGRVLTLRYTPELTFVLDEGLEEAVRMTSLLGRLAAEEGGEEE